MSSSEESEEQKENVGKQGGVISGEGFALLTAGSGEPEIRVLSLATHRPLLQSLQPRLKHGLLP